MKPYYQDDSCVIYHGDTVDVAPELGEFDLVVADPPYSFNSHGAKRREWAITDNVSAAIQAAAQNVKPVTGAIAVMTAASGRAIEWIHLSTMGLRLSRLLVWHKTFVNSPVAGPFRWDIVPIFVYGRGAFGRPQASSCFTSNGHLTGRTGHPAEIPVELGHWLIGPFGPDLRVLDPFMGTGPFMVAAKALGHRAIGIEIEEKYCEIAAKRLAQEVLAFG